MKISSMIVKKTISYRMQMTNSLQVRQHEKLLNPFQGHIDVIHLARVKTEQNAIGYKTPSCVIYYSCFFRISLSSFFFTMIKKELREEDHRRRHVW
jgi:hypothetical protein